MKKIILTGIAVCCFITVFSQNKAYYSPINKAELQIIKGNYKTALQNYQSAFKTPVEKKTTDLVNALKCSILTKSTEEVEYFVQCLLNSGLDYKDLYRDRFLKKRLKKLHLKCKPNRSHIDTVYRNQITALGIKDQLLRKKNNCYKKYRNEIDSIDKENIAQFLKYVKEKGFPSISRIGVQDIGGEQGWHIVVWHYSQARSLNNKLPDISNILLDAVKKDILRPVEYVTFLNLQNDSNFPKYGVDPLVTLRKGEFRILKSLLQQKNKINKNRAEIGLCSLEDNIKKIIFQDKNKYDFNFGISVGFFNLRNQDKSLKKKIEERSVPLKTLNL